jgi:hypothetical protein
MPAAAALTFAGGLATAATANAAPAPVPYPQSEPGDWDPPGDAGPGYGPASTDSGPNSSAAPRTSESQTTQNEACGANPGENNHTLGLPKLVNLNLC